MLAPISSVKHYVQHPSFAIPASSVTTLEIVDVVAAGSTPSSTAEVNEGSIIKAVFIEAWMTANADESGEFATVIVAKLPSGAPNPTSGDLSTLAAYANKKNIFWTFEGLVPPNSQNPIPISRQWIKIPKGKQRFGLGDKLVISISAAAQGNRYCGFETYKEYQ